jgi:hypothetical protein
LQVSSSKNLKNSILNKQNLQKSTKSIFDGSTITFNALTERDKAIKWNQISISSKTYKPLSDPTLPATHANG